MLSNESQDKQKRGFFSVVRCSLQHAFKTVMMLATTTTATLLTLPPEVLHRIFDDLDTQTILLSVTLVCRQLHLIVNTYNRFKLKTVSREQFVNISCHFPTENVISLTVCDDWAGLELEDGCCLVESLRRFTRLRSLTLHDIFDDELDILLSYLTTTHLI